MHFSSRVKPPVLPGLIWRGRSKWENAGLALGMFGLVLLLSLRDLQGNFFILLLAFSSVPGALMMPPRPCKVYLNAARGMVVYSRRRKYKFALSDYHLYIRHAAGRRGPYAVDLVHRKSVRIPGMEDQVVPEQPGENRLVVIPLQPRILYADNLRDYVAALCRQIQPPPEIVFATEAIQRDFESELQKKAGVL